MLEPLAFMHARQRTAEIAASARPVRPPQPYGPGDTRRKRGQRRG
jgi:hypothetical protein